MPDPELPSLSTILAYLVCIALTIAALAVT